MAGVQPVAVYAMKVPPGDILVPAVPDFAAMFRVSMAAIDPSAEADLEEVGNNKKPRATLKIIRFPSDLMDDSDDEDDDFDDYDDLLDGDDDEDSEEDDEEENGGPSKRPSKKDVLKALAEAEAADAMDEDEDDEEDSEDDEEAARAILAKLKKGKGKALAGDDEDEDDEEDSDEDDDEDESMEIDEVVVCTLDPEQHYQQPLDIVVGENERIFFKVTGTHTVHLTGNYVIPVDDGSAQLYDDEDDEDDYDLSPDEDELDELEDDEESDELDDMDDPRIMEIDDEEEAPKLVKAGKGKNKRAAEESEEENLDDLIAKAGKATEEPKLTKTQEKKLKKQKKNDGQAAAVAPEAAKPAANGEKKSVQFAKNLEQGPTPSPAPAAKDAKKDDKATGALGQKVVGGVTIDDKKLGKGPAAKKGDRVGMRYIGKLENGKVFDSNKKGKPFQFKLGAGEVIKGWDIGIAGLAVGGERRVTIPAHLGYGSRGAPPDIPPNSKLIFDVKMLEIK